MLNTASGALLTRQARATGGPPWDVLQITAADGSITLFAFQNDPTADGIIVKPVALNPDISYDVESMDVGPLGSAAGSDLITDGVEIRPSQVTAAHILTILASSTKSAPDRAR